MHGLLNENLTPKKRGGNFHLDGTRKGPLVAIHQKTALSRNGKVGDRELRCVTGSWPRSHVTHRVAEISCTPPPLSRARCLQPSCFPTSTKGRNFHYAISESTKISV
ncbi:hypothetical protein CDAR_385951 [Caerostris darwini]|uniref:Uncharacterized protein n=1 Tax=Caerostris darwini TaxID=1538125 RepID=A0AAV4QG67_9ARAC|nr:hypothetical protein CDAR_385951 [Caerostris darwini]